MLNRILFEPSECSPLDGGRRMARLPFDDPRAQHLANIIRAQDGDTMRVGVLDEGVDDAGVLRWCWPEGYSDGWVWAAVAADGERGTNGTPSSAATTATATTAMATTAAATAGARSKPGKKPKQKTYPDAVELTFAASEPSVARPRVDLLLALPRPLQLQRMLPMIASLGVGTIVLTNARKVEPDYFGSHLMRQPEAVRALLVEGCSQSGDVYVPKVVIARRLKPFLEDELDALMPRATTRRVVAHPRPLQFGDDAAGDDAAGGEVVVEGGEGGSRGGGGASVSRMGGVKRPEGTGTEAPRLMVAVGPEGGWIEDYELQLLAKQGFEAVGLGPRILRSDVAANALIALAHEQLGAWDAEPDFS